MKKIVKHIREEWYRYIFDTIVVIVGILIAFALNNWNEKRKEHDLIKSFASSLVTDLQEDIKEVRIIISQIEESIIRIDSLSNYTRHKQINEIYRSEKNRIVHPDAVSSRNFACGRGQSH